MQEAVGFIGTLASTEKSSTSVLRGLIQKHEVAMNNAQHRVVKELSVSMLEMLQGVEQRILFNRSLLGRLGNEAMRGAITEIMADFDDKVCRAVEEIDQTAQRMIGAYADMEENTEKAEGHKAEARRLGKSLFSRGKALREMEESVDAAHRARKAAELIIQLRQEISHKKLDIRQGQERITAMIEELMRKYGKDHFE